MGVKGIPNRKQLMENHSVNREGYAALRQSLYDFQTYAAAGQTQLNFFAQPVGQGGKTLSDTNMTLAGQMPANQDFLVQSIEIYLFPIVPNVAAQAPSAFGAEAIAHFVNDVYTVSRTGNLQFVIGSTPWLQEAPLGRFPPKTCLEGFAALSDASTIAASLQGRINYAHMAGRPYLITPASLTLISSQNFSITLNWPEGVQALPSGAPARIGVVLDGILYRRSQ